MGARCFRKAAVLAAVLLGAARSEASTVAEPIARLTLEGGYDSNPLFDGQSADRTGRVSPELGLKLRDHLWSAVVDYRGDWIMYERLQPQGTWSHRGSFALEARPMRRLELATALRGEWVSDPIGLAQAGIFRTGRESALLVAGTARSEYKLEPRVDVAATFQERLARFEDRSGGAMHAPGVEALWLADQRLSVGAAYALGLFQTFDPKGNALAYSHGVKARARWRESRHLTFEATAGPAVWVGPSGSAIVPEIQVQLLRSTPFSDLRLTAGHGLGIGATATPALVDALEFGAERRFLRRYVLKGDGGIWHTGVAPSGAESVTGYAVEGEAGVLVGMNVRLSLAAAQVARLDDPSAALRRTVVGVRLGWVLPAR